MKILGKEFFDCDAVELAEKMLGSFLCIQSKENLTRKMITETEAYCENDTACHGYKGRTERNDPMFRQGGTAYVYLCYGIHEMLNIAAGKDGEGQGVLIRGVEGAIGPGRVTKLLNVNRKFRYEFVPDSQRIWFEEGNKVDESRIERLKRVGIGYASQKDQDKLWRFRLKLDKM